MRRCDASSRRSRSSRRLKNQIQMNLEELIAKAKTSLGQECVDAEEPGGVAEHDVHGEGARGATRAGEEDAEKLLEELEADRSEF